MKLKHVVALGLIAVVVIWMTLPRDRGALDDGYALPQNNSTINAVSGNAAITNDNQSFTVRVARIDERNFVERVRVRGQTKAFRLVDVRAEAAGRVIATPVARGARVNAGDILCEIAVDSRATDLQEARSRQEQAQMEYNGALDLQERGLQSRVGIAQLKAALDSAIASVKRAELALERTQITAPFAGIMESRAVEVGDLMDMGGTCASLLDDTPMLLVGLVTEQDVGKLFLGAPVTAQLLTGERVEGKVTYISRAADPTSRSYAIEVEIATSENSIRQGITAEIFIAASEAPAHLIPPSSLTMNDAGAIGVKVVDQNNVVQFVEVRIVGENSSIDPGMWVRGLPPSSVLITHGQEIVFPGQVVNADFSWSSLTDSSL
ncbi:MAG: efflux RND transporter periplasmic adaptor subunit [Gammaproteobacteria bacterium]|nr:efflux RND transporter periplasmic adaptor subunit [Gammaproteobacteria bacterium]MDP2140807.1 efflux RND transporter periplasmic adaptor subunit [Gammaproteobacteria bacterium]MDP2347553.1 efflux RND transporter periplasmic adaptor subunit [Gammaproteobacteria bacterium]